MRTSLLSLLLALLAACASAPKDAAEPAPAAQSDQTVHKVIPLQFAAADQLAATLRGALAKEASAPQIMCDGRTNSLLVVATPGQMATVEQLVLELDIRVEKR